MKYVAIDEQDEKGFEEYIESLKKSGMELSEEEIQEIKNDINDQVAFCLMNNDKKFDEIFEKVSEINEEAYLNGYGWAALIESYLENNYPELYEDYDSDFEAGGYVGRYFGNTKENWEKIRKVAEIVEDLIENEDKIYKYIEENGDEIFWDSF